MILTSFLTAAIGVGAPAIPGRMTFSSGGREGEVVQQAIEKAERSLDETQTFGTRNRILEFLRTELVKRYGIPGWNGYQAKPVSRLSVRNAEMFAQALPPTMKEPAIRVIPNGFVTFAWRLRKDRTCTVAFDDDGRYHCAAIIGAQESAITTNSVADVLQKAQEVFA